jgi:hypothetical protein
MLTEIAQSPAVAMQTASVVVMKDEANGPTHAPGSLVTWSAAATEANASF